MSGARGCRAPLSTRTHPPSVETEDPEAVECNLEELAPEQPHSPHLELSQPPAAQADIATALVGITEFLKSTIKPKAKSSTHLKDPEPFDGRDPRKLK